MILSDILKSLCSFKMNNELKKIKLQNIPGSIFVENRSNTIVVQVKKKTNLHGLKR